MPGSSPGVLGWWLGAREDTGMRYSNSINWITGDGSGSTGLGLQIDWDGREAVVFLDVPSSSQAAPGIAHGGFLAALADHVMGFVAAQQGGRAAVTRQMTVDYLAPTRTLRAITIRARAESVTERTVVVSLEGAADDSGPVTFKARGDYARVSPARGHPGSTEVDYDALEERFDPSQVFGWLAGALKEAYLPGTVSSPLVLAVDVSDVTPRQWTFTATDRSLDIEAGDPSEHDVRFSGTVRSWRELVYRRRTVGQLTAAGSATVEDPKGRLPAFLASLGT
jgi:acyl-coenzyme A thioesterase PaaI-like protein